MRVLSTSGKTGSFVPQPDDDPTATFEIRLPMEVGFVESVASRRSDSLTEIVFATALRFSSLFSGLVCSNPIRISS